MPALALAVSTLSAHAGTASLADSLREAWRGAAEIRDLPPADDPDWVRTQRLFAALLAGDCGATVEREAATLGWTLRRQAGDGQQWCVLMEQPGHRSGRGLYAFADRGRHVLQAPHVPSDRHTGEIAALLGAEGQPRAIAWNTVPRAEADLAHLPSTALLAFSRAVAAAFPGERIVQLHGFDAGRRRSAKAADSGAIVSAARRPPGAAQRAVAACMRRSVAPDTRLYGDDVQELGGTTNSIAQALFGSGYMNFVHLEMALPLREALLASGEQRAALLDCLDMAR